MALQKQPVPIQLGQGIDTKTDPKHVLPGKLLLLENAVFKKRNRLDKRNGYRKVSNLTLAGVELPTGSAMEVFNDELLQYANQELYSYSAGVDRWVSKGAAVSAIVRTRQVVKNTARQTQADSAHLGGVSVYSWEDSRGGVRATVIDEESGAALLSDVELDSSATRTRCLAFGSYLFVFYYKSGKLYVRRLNPLMATAFESAIEVCDDINTTSPNYDVYAYQALRILVVYNVEGATQVAAGWLDDEGAVLSGALSPVTAAAEAATNCLAIIPGPSNTFYLAWHNGTGVRVAIYNNGFGTLHTAFTVEAPGTNAVNITGYALTDGTGIRLLYETTAAATYNRMIRVASIASGGTVSTAAADFLRSVGLTSKAWTYEDEDGNENHYVGIVHDSTLQATYFVARHDGLLVAKQQYSLAGGVTTRPILGNVWSSSTGVYAYAILNKVQLVSENATLFTPTGVAKTSLDFTNQDVFTAAQLGNNLHIVGGILSMYDGHSVVEHGFHLYPENLSASQSGAAGVGIGAYQYVAVYEWTDNYGQVHQSAPSVPLSFSVTGSARNVAVVVPTLRLTAKKSTRTNVSIALYRTEAAGTDVFYRVTSVLSPTANDPTADTVTITDTTADASLISNQILYTVGGVLEHLAPPASSAITVFKNRIILAGLESENDVWFSKEFKTGEPVAFTDQITKTVEPTGGGVQALAKIDDKLLMLKASTYYYTTGDGPNNTGQFGDFAEPSQVPQADVGTTNAQSIVAVPEGVMLKTAKGIYLIDSSLTPRYVGQEMEAFNALSVTSAALLADVNQVRFTTSDGVALVYDYEFKQWSTFTAHEAKDAVVWQGTYVLLKASGTVWKEDPAYFKDAGSPIRVRIGTGWLAVAGVIGFQRVYRVALLGEYKSPHKLRTWVGYDFSPAFTDSIPFDPDDSLDIARFGDGATYGADAVYGGTNSAYRYSAGLRVQKCQSIRFLIEEETTAATEGTHEAFNITTLGLLVGVKAGMGKFRAKQNLGTE